MARKRPRAAAAAQTTPASVSFAPAKGRRGAAATELIGRLDAKAEAAASAAEKDARRAMLLEKLKAIEEKRQALTATSSAAADESVEQLPAKAKKQTRQRRAKKGKASTTTVAEEESAQVTNPRKRAAGRDDDDGCPSQAPAKKARVNPKPAAESSRSKTKSGEPTKPQPVASRRTSRSRVPSVKISTMPGEETVGTANRCVGISRCPSIAFARKLVTGLLRDPSARPFSAPVTELWSPEDIPRYSEIVTNPMDLATIKKRLEGLHYLRKPQSSSEFGERVATSPLSSASFPPTSPNAFPSLAGSLGAGQSVDCVFNASGSADFVSGGGAGLDGVSRPAKSSDVIPTADRPTRDSGFVFDLTAFCGDVRLCFQNCMLYCPTQEPLHACAKALLDQFDRDIVDCPLPAPIRPESRTKKDRSSGRISVSDFANGAAISATTQATTSALSTGENCDSDAERATSGERQQKKPRRGKGKTTASDDSRSKRKPVSPTPRGGCPASVAVAPPPKPENPRQLKRKLEYLNRCRLHAVARENGIDEVPMTIAEKTRLTNRLAHIPVDKVAQLVRIVANASGRERVSENEEIEIDLDKFKPCTLREIERFVDGCVSRNVGGPPIPREKGGPGSEFETVAAVEAEMKRVSVALQAAKSRAAASSSGGGLWDASSSESSDNSDDESLSGSDSDSSDDEE